MAGVWEGGEEEEYGLQWDVDRVDLDFKTGDHVGHDDHGDQGGDVHHDHGPDHVEDDNGCYGLSEIMTVLILTLRKLKMLIMIMASTT